ncbi:MAG: hypothetical protein IT162_19185 [Bryobacterales bacterium]|nr:hypothetical protein [Bryobacterales bacterium]
MPTKPLTSSPVILISRGNGTVVIPSPSPLTRLHYFDGKFLRAEDLTREQNYVRRLVEYSNQAGGAGVVHGYDLTLASGGDSLRIGAGLAIDPSGRVLLLPEDFSMSIADLIEQSRRADGRPAADAKLGLSRFSDCEQNAVAPAVSLAAQNDLYLITVGHAEALCGNEDVFGKLCEEACITSTDRPFYVEGVVFRAAPLVLTAPLPTSSAVALSRAHLRSRVASAYFASEAERVATLISGSGLRSSAWCLGADAAGGSAVPLGVVSRHGSGTQFLDVWTARRERLDGPPRRYWAWKMSMRPWDVFLAQVLQFQCQLRDLPSAGVPPPGTDDPCRNAGRLAVDTSEALGRFTQYFEQATALLAQLQVPAARMPALDGGAAALADLRRRATSVGAVLSQALQQRMLITGGIVELPSAGYLPVVTEAPLSVNEQVRRWMGEGVDLRFCVVRPDFVAHALEEAQHMERISLLQGLDDPRRKPQVDILVPDGILERAGAQAAGSFAVKGQADGELLFGLRDANGAGTVAVELEGAARVETPDRGAVEFHLAAGDNRPQVVIGRQAAATPCLWLSGSVSRNPFTGDTSAVLVEFEVRATGARTAEVRFNGRLVFRRGPGAGQISGTLGGQLSTGGTNAPKPVKLAVSATLGASSLTVALDLDGGQLVLSFEQDGKAGPIRLNGALVTGKVNRQLGLLTLRPEPAVARPEHPLHALALRVLSQIEKATRDADFVETASPQIFPPLPPVSTEAIVRATLPWVLFHRRRTKQCEPEAAVVTPPEPRCYRVFHLLNRVAGGDAVPAAEIRKALLSGDAGFFTQRGLVFQPVDNVEFQSGLPSLETAASDIQKDWAAVQAGPNLVYAAIASRPAARAEGETLALARLEVFTKTLLATRAVDAVNMTEDGPDELDEVPAVFETACSDGVIAVVTEGNVVATPLTAVMTTSPVTLTQPARDSRLGTATVQMGGGEAGRTLRTNLQFFLDVDLTNASTDPPQLLIDGAAAPVALSSRATERSWVFAGVEIVEPGPEATRLLTIRNLVGNTTSVATGAQPDVKLFLSSTASGANPGVLPIAQPSGTIAFLSRQVPFTLTAEQPSPIAQLRSEGTAELTSAVVLRGAGGTPGATLTVDLQADLSLPVAPVTGARGPVLQLDAATQVPGVVQGAQVTFAGAKITVPAAGAAPVQWTIQNVRVNVGAAQGQRDVFMKVNPVGGDPVNIVNPPNNLVVGQITALRERVGQIVLTETPVRAARRRVDLANPVSLQFQADGSLLRRLTTATGQTVSRALTGLVQQVELVPREGAADADAEKRLAAAVAELRRLRVLTGNESATIGVMSAELRALVPQLAGEADDLVFLHMAPLV